jgi:protein SCO1/2
MILAGCFVFTALAAGQELPKGGDFILKTPSGILNTKELRGKNLLLFFGFLHCPYVCPTTVRELNRMAKDLPVDLKQNTRIIFVTVDPERDTPEKLKAHFSKFGPIFIPAYGTPDEVRKAIKLFGGDFIVTKGKSPQETSVDHNSNIFIMNEKGDWVDQLPFDAKASQIRDAIYLSKNKPPFWTEQAKAERLHRLGGNKDCDLSEKACEFITENGVKYVAEITPRPVKHLRKNKITIRIANDAYTIVPEVADFIGVELVMGLIRPKLQKGKGNVWTGTFQIPTCDLRTMHFTLRLLLKDAQKENYEIRYGFQSYNPDWDPKAKRMH